MLRPGGRSIAGSGLVAEDIIIMLGDVGLNYYGGRTDKQMKIVLNDLDVTIFCIHGNHEMRPATIPSYVTKEWNGGTVWYEPHYPNILFAKDGEIYEINGIRYLVIGGAYSVDKYQRLLYGYGWWADEQPSAAIKQYVEEQIASKSFDVILSHTCPYEPGHALRQGDGQAPQLVVPVGHARAAEGVGDQHQLLPEEPVDQPTSWTRTPARSSPAATPRRSS